MMTAYKTEDGVSRLSFVYMSTNQASMPRVGIRVMIWRMRQNVKKSPATILSVISFPCGV